MVNEQEQDSGRRSANQGVRDVIPEPNKINASTPYDFNGRNLTPLRRAAAGHHHAGEIGIPAAGGTDPDLEADSASHGLVPVRAGHRARPLHRLSAAEPVALHRPRP